MKNVIKWKDYTISRWITVFDNEGNHVDEFDSMPEAKASWYAKLPSDYKFKYSAAEWVDEYGDTNIAVHGDSLKEVMDKLKKLL